MDTTLHVVNGDGAGNCLFKTDIIGEILVCRDLLYDGTRSPGWPNHSSLLTRSQFLSQLTGGGLGSESILKTLKGFYQKLSTASKYENVVLWFDACLCDQSMLAHILVCLKYLAINKVELLCVDSFPGIVPFNGLGQLLPSQLASLYSKRYLVTAEQFEFAETVDRAFATQDKAVLTELSQEISAPLPFIIASAKRWLLEQPDLKSGLGRLEYLALEAIRSGCKTPGEIFLRVAEGEKSPQFWGDTILWLKINALADRKPPLVCIEGPTERLPQWKSSIKLDRFVVTISPNS